MMRRSGRCFSTAPFTSGTTRGMSASRRKWEVLSTTTAPAAAAFGANSALMLPPAEKSARDTLEKSKVSKRSTSTGRPLNMTVLLSDRALARAYSFATGKSRDSRISIMASPTAPVAPTTATEKPSLITNHPTETQRPP